MLGICTPLLVEHPNTHSTRGWLTDLFPACTVGRPGSVLQIHVLEDVLDGVNGVAARTFPTWTQMWDDVYVRLPFPAPPTPFSPVESDSTVSQSLAVRPWELSGLEEVRRMPEIR